MNPGKQNWQALLQTYWTSNIYWQEDTAHVRLHCNVFGNSKLMEIPPNAWKLMSCPVPRRCWSMIFYLREIPINKPPRPYIGWCSVWRVFIGPNLFFGFFSRKGNIFGICRSPVFSVSVSFSDSRCYVLSSSAYFLKIGNDLKWKIMSIILLRKRLDKFICLSNLSALAWTVSP